MRVSDADNGMKAGSLVWGFPTKKSQYLHGSFFEHLFLDYFDGIISISISFGRAPVLRLVKGGKSAQLGVA